MTEAEVVRAIRRLREVPPSVDDWRDLHETIEAYKDRCLARRIAKQPALVEAIKRLAEL